MKQLFLGIFTLATFSLHAQKNIFFDQSYWKTNPDLASVQAEVTKGNNPSESNRMGMDAVVYAINAKASPGVIKYLLDQKGNEVDKLTHDSRTYLFWAASKGNTEVIEYLISKGAKLNVEDSHGMTPISFAASSGQADTKVYDALLRAGANVKERNNDGASLLLLAIPNDNDLSLTNYFISKGLSLSDVDAAGNTAFNYAAKAGNINLMKALIQKGVKYSDNAMIMAAQGTRASANGIEVYQFLETLKIKPNAINRNGENALHYVARKPKQEEIIKYFISKGVDVNQVDKDGNTAFMNAAAANRDTATLELLVSRVKNINQVNKKGVSALDMAVRGNSADVVALLIGKGAGMNAVDADGNNLAYYLIQSYNPQAFERGAANGGTRADDFGLKLKLLQDKGFNFTAPQKDGNTLYHLAVTKNDLSLLKRIEKLNVDVNAKNKEGLTPLHKAAMVSRDNEILKYLLSIGAQKEATTEFKETAYELAKENESFSKNNVSVDFLK
ncbi:ankyrin repeat domain-containing protein [Danxiaibacter flavus]|uniref:Ankyrin repeat domain-containing protein n=1 Tax=Danxiaibacter flavus TaxID=3049108 RepID=A0ABV3ZL81_9BACT|nr:ankyrin repeat domain-containing protein [Chitinophagaceae bacterium DXS]